MNFYELHQQPIVLEFALVLDLKHKILEKKINYISEERELK